MSISRMIALAVLFCALMLAWMILMVLAIPFRVGLPYIHPVKLNRAIWNILWMKVLLPLFIFILCLLFVLYLVYKALEPIFIIGAIVKALSPFKEMRNMCIISFFDKILALGYTNPKTAFPQFKDAAMCVLVKALGALGDEFDNPIDNPSYNNDSVDTNVNYGDKSFTKAEYDEIKDEELQCILESTTPVQHDSSKIDRLKASLQNQTATLSCKMQSVGNAFKILAQASRN